MNLWSLFNAEFHQWPVTSLTSRVDVFISACDIVFVYFFGGGGPPLHIFGAFGSITFVNDNWMKRGSPTWSSPGATIPQASLKDFILFWIFYIDIILEFVKKFFSKAQGHKYRALGEKSIYFNSNSLQDIRCLMARPLLKIINSV